MLFQKYRDNTLEEKSQKTENDSLGRAFGMKGNKRENMYKFTLINIKFWFISQIMTTYRSIARSLTLFISFRTSNMFGTSLFFWFFE